MDKKNNKNQEPVTTGLRIYRAIGIILVVAAIGYIVWNGDFDSKGLIGYIDDCFIFMAAYMFARGSFQRPERHYIRRQLYMLAALFAILGLCWFILLAFYTHNN